MKKRMIVSWIGLMLCCVLLTGCGAGGAQRVSSEGTGAATPFPSATASMAESSVAPFDPASSKVAADSAVPDSVPADAVDSSGADDGKNSATVQSVESVWQSGEQHIVIETGGQSFGATLQDNETARVFAAQLPLTLDMSELNGNEKYYDLEQALPVNAHQPGAIQNGDLMLYGSDCLVLFYESFSSGYSYTRIGAVGTPEGLADALGSGSAQVTFRLE